MKIFFLLIVCVALASAVVKPKCPKRDSRNAVILADPWSCSKFYICSNGVAIRQKCPAGLKFNDKLKVCDWPNKAGCWRPWSIDDLVEDVQETEE